MEKIVIAEKMTSRKEQSLDPLLPSKHLPFVAEWKKKHVDILMKQLGTTVEAPSLKFLHAIYFAPLFATTTVPLLKWVYMADACHLNFDKYTLFCCYGVTANANMSLIGFTIMFGNENAKSWHYFWKFIVELHPSINSPDVTIITDQDKGQKNVIADHCPNVGQFHCSWHRHQNIIKMCGGEGGRFHIQPFGCTTS
jgi:hypothetical protein